MKILVHNPQTGGAFARFPVLLSVMQQMVDDGHEVVSLECDSAVPACVITLEQDAAICRYCMARGAKGRQRIEPAPAHRTLSQYLVPAELASLRATTDTFADVAALKDIEHEGFDVGYAALSSYAQVTRDPEPDLRDPRIRAALQRLLNTGRIVFEAWRRALDVEEPDRAALFNGRLAIDRGALRACQERGVDCDVYEIASAVDRLMLYENALPQDIGRVNAQIDAMWEAAAPDRADVGAAFFAMRRAGRSTQRVAAEVIRTNEAGYVQAQRRGTIPPDWDADRKNIVVYGSSDDEYCAISTEWEDAIYPGQSEALDALCRGLDDDPRLRIYFRMHPRLAGMDRPFVDRVRAMAGTHANLTVIPPESPICSYTLLDQADVVCTFRSTMAYEAAIAGKPCITLARSLFSHRGATYDPASHAEVLALLRSELAPRDPLPALRYGYYRMRMGFPNRYYKGDQRGGGRRGYTFKGRPVFVGGLTLLAYRLARFRQRRRWT